MNFAVGEIREFATGMMVATARDGFPGCGEARMQTIQRIWDGEKWCDWRDASAILNGINAKAVAA